MNDLWKCLYSRNVYLAEKMALPHPTPHFRGEGKVGRDGFTPQGQLVNGQQHL